MKTSFSESMERVGQLTGNNIRRLFKKAKLNCKRNRHTWPQKTECIPNLWHQPMALRQPLRNHLQRVAVTENLQYKGLLIQLRTGTTKVGKMVEKILERGDHGEEIQRDFVLHIISTTIIRSMNGDCFVGTLKLFMDMNQIPDYNWHAYLLMTSLIFLVELSLVKRDAKTDGFQQQYIRQLMQLNKEIKMKRSFAESIEGERDAKTNGFQQQHIGQLT
ncbi:hypothetical protein Cgig2_017525 [Carnegiea gigantea]|uniref:Uncharacterized protein n=1 Tax=Carnegiea gigantea TaxID=171969 RepID=A0A9Q1K3Q5_9CARY|nr:hypothetical protein Cgig2_017525 [Carnegiea gigantea]